MGVDIRVIPAPQGQLREPTESSIAILLCLLRFWLRSHLSCSYKSRCANVSAGMYLFCVLLWRHHMRASALLLFFLSSHMPSSVFKHCVSFSVQQSVHWCIAVRHWANTDLFVFCVFIPQHYAFLFIVCSLLACLALTVLTSADPCLCLGMCSCIWPCFLHLRRLLMWSFYLSYSNACLHDNTCDDGMLPFNWLAYNIRLL